MGNDYVKKCSSCGKEMQIDAAFCTNCGTRFEEKETGAADTAMKKCSSCGKEMHIDAVFCANCGSSFEKKESHMENGAVKKCASCGKEMLMDAVFCTNCGSSFERKEDRSTGGGSPIESQLLNLANDFLSVRQVHPARFEFSSQTGAEAPNLKVKIKYDAVAQLEPEKRQVTFWEQMVESSSGMTAGFFSKKTVQKGVEVTEVTHGNLLFGGKYGFEYGKLREVVKAIAAEQGWKFKLAIFKPKG
ncbi:MAG: zinc ribbon domain-containing protein [Syntrophaceae bacterium]